MSTAGHEDSSQKWLTFFFVCFAITVLGIGLYAIYAHNNAPSAEEGKEPAGGHGMLLPVDMKKLPHLYNPVV